MVNQWSCVILASNYYDPVIYLFSLLFIYINCYNNKIPAKSLAFEVPLHDAEEDNVIKKHPPKRLQRLEDQQLPPLTHEALDEKQAEAEQRRLQVLISCWIKLTIVKFNGSHFIFQSESEIFAKIT